MSSGTNGGVYVNELAHCVQVVVVALQVSESYYFYQETSVARFFFLTKTSVKTPKRQALSWFYSARARELHTVINAWIHKHANIL